MSELLWWALALLAAGLYCLTTLFGFALSRAVYVKLWPAPAKVVLVLCYAFVLAGELLFEGYLILRALGAGR